MSVFLFALALCISAFTPVEQGTAAQSASSARQADFQKQGKDALEREQVRAKQPLCEKAQNNLDLQFCLKAEFGKTDANRILYVRSIGGLLRVSFDTQPPPAKTKHLPFDDGEAAWLTYRDRTCQSIYDSYQGGSGAAGASWTCEITATRNHMQDLSQIYSELWQ